MPKDKRGITFREAASVAALSFLPVEVRVEAGGKWKVRQWHEISSPDYFPEWGIYIRDNTTSINQDLHIDTEPSPIIVPHIDTVSYFVY